MAHIGLTGRTSCGKSTVARILCVAGFRIVDCDKIAHELLFHKDIKKAIEEFFGPAVFSDGEVSRPALGAVVFDNTESRRYLENIMRPKVYERVFESLDNASPVVIDFFDIIGTPIQEHLKETWVVTCGKEQQLERLMARNNFTKEVAEKRMSAQKSQEELVAGADVIIDNSGSLYNTELQVLEQLKRLTQREIVLERQNDTEKVVGNLSPMPDERKACSHPTPPPVG